MSVWSAHECRWGEGVCVHFTVLYNWHPLAGAVCLRDLRQGSVLYLLSLSAFLPPFLPPSITPFLPLLLPLIHPFFLSLSPSPSVSLCFCLSRQYSERCDLLPLKDRDSRDLEKEMKLLKCLLPGPWKTLLRGTKKYKLVYEKFASRFYHTCTADYFWMFLVILLCSHVGGLSAKITLTKALGAWCSH